MKILRLILFIPGFILTIFISNLLFELLVYLTNYFSSFESSPYAFIWDDFIKSIFISIASILAGLYIYPLKKKLIERLKDPRISAAALTGMPDCYKIKLLRVGYRLVYRVEDDIVFVTVIAVGKRDKLKTYTAAKSRI